MFAVPKPFSFYKKINWIEEDFWGYLDFSLWNQIPVSKSKSEQKERKPEALDVCLHTDDIATVSLLSGLKWIEPALPILYSVSGYKAGSGYRN